MSVTGCIGSLHAPALKAERPGAAAAAKATAPASVRRRASTVSKASLAASEKTAKPALLPPHLRPVVLGYARSLGKVGCGLGLVAGLSWGMAATGATAALLRILAGASVLDRVAGSVPFIGPLLAVLMGVGGNYGFASVGLIVFNVVDACFGGAEGWGAVFRWFNAHASIAFALSPLWLPAASVLSLPVLTGVATGVAYLSWSVDRSQQTATPPSFSHALFALGVSLGLSPVGAQAASGVSGINILRQAVNFPLLAFGCNAIVSAGKQLYTLFGHSGSSLAGAGQPIHTGGAKLALPAFDEAPAGLDAAQSATVFLDAQTARGLEDVIRHNREQIRRGLHDGPRCVLLQAPAGCGKLAVACALANALQTRMYRVERETYEATGKGHSGQALAQQLGQWAQEAKQLGKPVLLYVPELLLLAPRIADAETGKGPGAKAAPASDDFTSQLKTLMASESGGEKPNLLFVLASTYSPEQVKAGTDDAIHNRITRRFSWQAPDAQSMPRILGHKLQLHLRASVIHEELCTQLLADPNDDALLATLGCQARLTRAVEAKLSGGQVDAWVVEAVDDVAARYLRQRGDAFAPDEADTRFALQAALSQELARTFDRLVPTP